MSDLFVDAHGSGEHVVLTHGSLATGSEEWEAQQPLAEEGFRLLVIDRRGYGRSPAAEGEDFQRDAEDIAVLMDGGAHLVGHSYGGLGVMLAAARRPEATRSLAVLEPAAITLGQDHQAARDLTARMRAVWDLDLPDRSWMERFLEAVGSNPKELPPELLDAALPPVPVMRRGRLPADGDLPLAELASATYPKLVVSGGHDPGFEAICDDLAKKIGASRSVIEGAGHEIQFTGSPSTMPCCRCGAAYQRRRDGQRNQTPNLRCLAVRRTALPRRPDREVATPRSNREYACAHSRG